MDILDTAKLILRLKSNGMSDLCIFAVRPYYGTKLYNDCRINFTEEELDRYAYINDYTDESNPFVRSKLKAYNTISLTQICAAYSPTQIRRIIRALYTLFVQDRKQFTDDELYEIIFRFL